MPVPIIASFTENGCYLIDFEGGEIAHALLSGVYGHVRFPTSLVRL